MKGYHYVGFDVHKKTIAFCVKEADGKIVEEQNLALMLLVPDHDAA
jgi:hypothetical protein